MKNIMKMLTIATIILCCGSTANALFLTDLGIVEYNDYLQVDIIYPGEVELEYVYSSIDQSAIVYDKLAYIPETNTTRYLFTSELYFPAYYEILLGMEEFLFQDINSKELYIVSIDMTSVVVPDDPYQVELIALTELYNNMSIELEETLTNLTNTWNELNDLIILQNTTYNSLNETLARNTIIEILLANQTSELRNLKNDLNLTDEQLLNMTSKAGNFQRFFNEITSYKSGFNFVNAGESEWYNTLYSLEKTIETKTDELNGTPFIIVFFILFTTVITAMICYWKFAKSSSSPENMEIQDGTDRTTTKVNRFKSALKILPLSLKRKQRDPAPAMAEIKPDETTMMEPKTKPTIKNNSIPEPSKDYTKLEKEVDLKIGKLEKKIDLNHQDLTGIAEKINTLLAETTSPSTMKK